MNVGETRDVPRAPLIFRPAPSMAAAYFISILTNLLRSTIDSSRL
jgi:hypothetical protein